MYSVDAKLVFMLLLITHFQMVNQINQILFIISHQQPKQMDTLTLCILAWVFFKIMIMTSNSHFMDLVESFQVIQRLVIVSHSMETSSIRKSMVLMELLMLITNHMKKSSYMVELNSILS